LQPFFLLQPFSQLYGSQIKLAMQYWLVKSEPHKYSWEQFNKDGRTMWDGVRNFAARNNLRSMKTGDLVFFYHSNEGKEIVGVAKVVKESYQDPTTDDANWLVVELSPVETLRKPVTLEQIKADPELKGIELVRLGRLSVSAVKKEEFDYILKLSND
jgi:predicted RNA-binding protein with PUA-like domain